MAGRLEDKVAIVTGAGSIGPGWGNGKATSVLFAREGARIFAVDIDLEAARETEAIIHSEGGECTAHQADVAKAAEVEALVRRCIDLYGRVDVLHNNVGIVALGGPVELDEADWDRVSDVNLKSAYLTCKFVIPHMLAQGGGAIVNISSVASLRWLGVSYLPYFTTKAGLNQLTQAVALEYARQNIRCNAILPGFMNTPMVHSTLAGAYADGDIDKMIEIRDAQCPMGRMGDAWDVAYAALYLASDEARYVTGAQLVVDGGLTCKVV